MDTVDTYWSKSYASGRDFTLIGTGEVDKIIAITSADDHQKHLDIGCGTGQLTREFYHRGFTTVGIDPSTAAIEKARMATTRKGLTYYHGTIDQDTEVLRSEGVFDVVTCKLVYAFIEDKETFLHNVNSILAVGGFFVVITPHINQVAPEKVSIAVDPKLTLSQLGKEFDVIETYAIAGPLGHCYICKKR